MNNDIMRLLANKEIEPFEISAAPLTTIYRVIVDKEFREVSQFADLVSVLDNAEEGDIVHMRLSTVGGALHAIIPLISSMKNTQAHIHIHVESDTASAGTLLMMLAHSLYVNEYSTIMFHNVQYGAFGHGGNVEAQVRHQTAANKKVVRDMYNGFLTEGEIKRLEDGLELYLTPVECMERFAARGHLEDQEDDFEVLQEMLTSIEAEEKTSKPARKSKKQKESVVE